MKQQGFSEYNVLLLIFHFDMRFNFLERNAEYLLSLLLLGLAIFLMQEVWVSVQDLEIIYQQLLEGAIFTEGPPISGLKGYLLFCLGSTFWFLLVFASMLSQKQIPLWFGQASFILLPFWVITFYFLNERADYEWISIGQFLRYQFLPSWNLLSFLLAIGFAIIGVRFSRILRNNDT
jgi:hypothetical protein